MPSQAGIELLKLIPPDAKFVLEVGCGSGLLGALYKSVNPHGRYVGCESDTDAAARARHHLDSVAAADPELLEIDSVGVASGQIDCLIYCNALERASDPWSMVKRQARWLSNSGILLAAVANVQYWRTLRDLMRGRHEAWERAFRDQGEERPFTLDGLRRMFEEADMNPLNIVGLGQKSEEFDRFLDVVR
jgi:tRNA A58 N-methylase Trm61